MSAATPTQPMEYAVSRQWLTITVIGWGLVMIVTAVTILLPIVALVAMGAAILRSLTTHLVLDDSGVTLRQGLVVINEQHLPFTKIHAVTSAIGPLGRRFDYGTIRLSVGNDQNHITVANLAGCADLKRRLEAHLAR